MAICGRALWSRLVARGGGHVRRPGPGYTRRAHPYNSPCRRDSGRGAWRLAQHPAVGAGVECECVGCWTHTDEVEVAIARADEEVLALDLQTARASGRRVRGAAAVGIRGGGEQHEGPVREAHGKGPRLGSWVRCESSMGAETRSAFANGG